MGVLQWHPGWGPVEVCGVTKGGEGDGRTLGLLGATGVGVGAIVGGGVLALAGVAFVTTGPSAILAFGANGLIALLTVLSFAELAARFPESGGTYTYARKVLTVEAAFAVGWVVWFASVVAAVLYALGFAAFLVPVLDHLWRLSGGEAPGWLASRPAILLFAAAPVGFYAWGLTRSTAGGKQWATVGKVVIFVVLLAGGVWGLLAGPPTGAELAARWTPFLEGGQRGLMQAMGYTFIALQGFDLIAAVGGEVRQPQRNIPRAMLLSLGVALAIYLPLLFLIPTTGTNGEPVSALAARDPEILVAHAAGNFFGPAGYWMVLVAGLLSMLSALQANLMAVSRFALTMARDRTLPGRFSRLLPGRNTPLPAIQLTVVVVILVLVAVPDVAVAGAMASLIFLGSFALTHWVAWLVRRRSPDPGPFRTPLFPLVPLVGGLACVGLALFQALAVPAAGALAALWLSAGAVLYAALLGRSARVADASAEGLDPQLMRLRGRTPLILVPIANPENAPTLVAVSDALAPRGIARVLLLSVVRPPPEGWSPGTLPRPLADAQAVLGGALSTAFASRMTPEALVTVGEDPWKEIARVVEAYHCETLLLGLGELSEALIRGPLETLLNTVTCDVVILRAQPGWDPGQARQILVPSGGGQEQSYLRARFLGHLARVAPRRVTWLRVLPGDAEDAEVRRARRGLKVLARDEVPGGGDVEVERSDDALEELVRRAGETDLLVLGIQRLDRRHKAIGPLVVELSRRTTCPLVLISRGT